MIRSFLQAALLAGIVGVAAKKTKRKKTDAAGEEEALLNN